MGIQIDGQTGQIRALGGNVNLDGEVTATVLNQNVSGVTTFTDAQFTNGFSVTGVVTSTTIGTDEIHLGSSQPDSNPVIIRQITSGKKAGTVKFAKTTRDAQGRSVEIEDEEVSVGIGTTVSINTTGIITASSFHGSSFHGDGSNLSGLPQSGMGINDANGNVGYGATSITFDGSGVSSVSFDSNSGIATVTVTGGGGGSSITSELIGSATILVPSGHVYESSSSYMLHPVDHDYKSSKFCLVFHTTYDDGTNKDMYANGVVIDVNTSTGAVTVGATATYNLTAVVMPSRSGWEQGTGANYGFACQWGNGGYRDLYSSTGYNGNYYNGYMFSWVVNSSNNTVSFTCHGQGGYSHQNTNITYSYYAQRFTKKSSGVSYFIYLSRRYTLNSTTTVWELVKVGVNQDGSIASNTVTNVNSTVFGSSSSMSYFGNNLGNWEDLTSTPGGSLVSSFVHFLPGDYSSQPTSPTYMGKLFTCDYDGNTSDTITYQWAVSAYYYAPYFALFYDNGVALATNTYTTSWQSYGGARYIQFSSYNSATTPSSAPAGWPHATYAKYFNYGTRHVNPIAANTSYRLDLDSSSDQFYVLGLNRATGDSVYTGPHRLLKMNTAGNILAQKDYPVSDVTSSFNDGGGSGLMLRVYPNTNASTDPSHFCIVAFDTQSINWFAKVSSFPWPSEIT